MIQLFGEAGEAVLRALREPASELQRLPPSPPALAQGVMAKQQQYKESGSALIKPLFGPQCAGAGRSLGEQRLQRQLGCP